MVSPKIFGMCVLLFLTTSSVSFAEEGENEEKVEEIIKPDDLQESMEDTFKNAGKFFKDSSDNIKEGAESGFGAMKDWASGMSDMFGKAKFKIEEAGKNMKTTFGESASNVKEEVESGASKMASQAQKAMESFKFF